MYNTFEKTIAILALTLLVISALPGIPFTKLDTTAQGSTVITSLPYDITTPGTYILESDLTTSTYGINVTVENVTIIGNGYTITGPGSESGIIIDGIGGNVTIENIKIKGFEFGIYVNNISSLGDKYAYAGIVIKNNTIENTEYGIEVDNVYNYGGVIIDNVIVRNSSSGGIDLYYNNDIVITNSYINGSGTLDAGVIVDVSEGVYINNVTVSNTHYPGFDLFYAWEVAIVNSRATNSIAHSGISIYRSRDVLILNTKSVDNAENGFLVKRSENVYIVSCNASNNGIYGMDIYSDYSPYPTQNVFVKHSYISNNSNGGVYVGSYSRYINITYNQIAMNEGYGAGLDTSYTGIFINHNVFWENTNSPQAYDTNSVGEWSSNYWSDLSGATYVFNGNSDDSPLTSPLYDVEVTNVTVPSSTVTGIVPVTAILNNPSFADSDNINVTLYWSEPPVFNETSFTWIDVDQSSVTTVNYGDILTDYGNYTLLDEDDGYFVYKLPWPINMYGYNYTYISVSTNGYIELLSTNQSALQGYYTVHTYGTHRSVSSKETYGSGVTTLFAYSGDLYESSNSFASVFNMGDKVIVAFNGTTYEDEDDVNYPVQFQVALYNNGSILISLGNISYTALDGDGFTGLYFQPIGIEITAGYTLPPYTSYRINPSTHIASITTASVGAGEEKNITLNWNTNNLPHYSPFSLWLAATSSPGEFNPVNNMYPYVVTVNVTQPSTVVGGELVKPNPVNIGSEGLVFFTATAVVLAAGLLLWRKRN
ncbi:MAG: right-handed parallel beta-helix repeat-containing protein [Desulfurococcales archaeon]|nr:right-handed parallel beta-helix repeat-containing protein [Desulfurococcales archaeon]